MAAADFLRWLDVIPGRNWLIFGEEGAALAEIVRADYLPAGVTVLAEVPEALPFETGTFDVVLSAGGRLTLRMVEEMRRVLVPAAVAAGYGGLESGELERLFRAAGLYVVQTHRLEGAAAVRGSR